MGKNMTNRAMIMTGESLVATLDGRKQETRRLVKLPPKPRDRTNDGVSHIEGLDRFRGLGAPPESTDRWAPSWIGGPGCHRADGPPTPRISVVRGELTGQVIEPPFHVGESVYIKESWAPIRPSVLACRYEAPPGSPERFTSRWRTIIPPTNYEDVHAVTAFYAYKATPHDGLCGNMQRVWFDDDTKPSGPWKNPLFMPRCVSRLSILLTAVRAEWLQDITEDGAKAEGVELDTLGQTYRAAYADRWDGIYESAPHVRWRANPLVWVYAYQAFHVDINVGRIVPV